MWANTSLINKGCLRTELTSMSVPGNRREELWGRVLVPDLLKFVDQSSVEQNSHCEITISLFPVGLLENILELKASETFVSLIQVWVFGAQGFFFFSETLHLHCRKNGWYLSENLYYVLLSTKISTVTLKCTPPSPNADFFHNAWASFLLHD